MRYFTGQVLSVDDLRAEQEYHRSMRYLHNRLHGSGVVSGLDVEVAGSDLHVGPGLAIDAAGREIVLAERVCVDASPVTREEARNLHVTWDEQADRPVPGPQGETVYTRWVEMPRLSLDLPGKAPDDGLFLARVTRGSNGALRVDVSHRPGLGRHGKPPVERRRYRGRRP